MLISWRIKLLLKWMEIFFLLYLTCTMMSHKSASLLDKKLVVYLVFMLRKLFQGHCPVLILIQINAIAYWLFCTIKFKDAHFVLHYQAVCKQFQMQQQFWSQPVQNSTTSFSCRSQRQRGANGQMFLFILFTIFIDPPPHFSKITQWNQHVILQKQQ